jgi:Na+-translocating ferredoxin:NAD+ oxidoreductase subunit C
MISTLTKTFKGGIHPPDHKALTSSKAIETLPLPLRVVIPLQQHIGRISEAIVQVGDRVLRGQPISKPAGPVSVSSHASISGTVKAIESFPHPLGQVVPAMVIETDGLDEPYISYDCDPKYMSLSAEEMKNRIADAGITGMGGATFPTHVKLLPPKDKPIDTVILNGAECEPYLTSDHRLMLESPEDIIKGLRIIMKVLGVKKGFVAIENNKPDAIAIFGKLLANDPEVSVCPLKVKYPQGAEKQLIYAATKRRVPAGKLPMEVGCVVQNVGTAKAIYDAVACQKPLIERVVTVTGAVRNPKNLLVRIGTSVKELIDYCGGFSETPGKVIMGGPMMGIAQFTLDVPIIKGSSGVVVLSRDEVKENLHQECISCARCVDVCPMNLMPTLLVSYVESGRFDLAKEAGIMNCMECGSCAFVCAAGRNVMHLMRFGKFMIQELEKAEKK